MRIIKQVMTTIFISFLVYGCVSLPEPDNENQTLVVGIFIHEAKGYQTYGSVSVNGTTKVGINITLQELNSGKNYSMRTKSEGIFYSTNIPQGVYRFTRVYIKKESGSSWADITWSEANIGTTRIQIEHGRVNNLGTITLNATDGPNATGQRIYNQGYDQVRNLFQKQKSSSNWNQREWLNNGINRANSVGYTPPVTREVQPIQLQSSQPPIITSSPSVEPPRQQQSSIEGALEKAAQEAIRNVQQRSRIAIVYITAPDKNTTDFIAGELEYIWVKAGYLIIDRSQLDIVRWEQNYQLNGEVDDNTAISIGKIAGADIIVTGRVDGEGSLRRLRLRVINTQTAQVIGVASERM
jgi:hypothetical protein